MGTINWDNKTILRWGKDKVKAAEQPIDDKLLRAIRDSLIRGGFVNDIQDNADEYIKFGYQPFYPLQHLQLIQGQYPNQ